MRKDTLYKTTTKLSNKLNKTHFFKCDREFV